MSDIVLIACLAFMALCAMYGACHLIDNFIDSKKSAKVQKRHAVHTSDDGDGYLLIKRDSQGAQGFVHFNSDFDLFEYEDGDYICLKIQVEEVIDQ